MLKKLGYEKQSDSTKAHKGSCRVNSADTGVWGWDFGQSKPKITQAMTGVMIVGHVATRRQINKWCSEFFTVL